MRITQLSTQEASLTGFSMVVNLKVQGTSTTDLAAASATLNVISIPVGMWVKDVAIDVKTAWNTLTTPAINMGVGASGANTSGLLSGVSLGSTGYSASSSGVVVNSASQFVTVTQTGTGSNATTGEAIIFLRLVDLSKGRNSFAT